MPQFLPVDDAKTCISCEEEFKPPERHQCSACDKYVTIYSQNCVTTTTFKSYVVSLQVLCENCYLSQKKVYLEYSQRKESVCNQCYERYEG